VSPDWREQYLGGSPDEEARRIRAWADEIHEIQRRNADGGVARRAFHAKIHAGLTNAEFRVAADLDERFAGGIFRPGAVHPAVVRFSNAAGTIRPDAKRDLRGVAIRVADVQDFLLTNAPASHARDAEQFMAAAKAGTQRPPLSILGLLRTLGPRETVRMLRSLRRALRRAESLAEESYWSRAPFLLGDAPVKFKLAPAATASGGDNERGPDCLRDDLADRLRAAALVFPFQAQRFVDERTTPIEDGAAEWKESDSPPVTIAELVLPQQELTNADGALVEAMAFTPWNTNGIRPLGSLNRARKLVYEASASRRASRTPSAAA
jgi:hypothetical protein